MNPKEFKQFWKKQKFVKLYSFKSTKIDATKITKESFAFLVEYGMPSMAAPMLDFIDDYVYHLQSPNEMCGIAEPSLENYLVIGFNGSGDSVCIDSNSNDEIVYLNHDIDFERVFINTNIAKFFFCLTAYCNFINEVNSTNESNFIDGNIELEQFIKIREEMLSIDSECLAQNSFWSMELRL